MPKISRNNTMKKRLRCDATFCAYNDQFEIKMFYSESESLPVGKSAFGLNEIKCAITSELDVALTLYSRRSGAFWILPKWVMNRFASPWKVSAISGWHKHLNRFKISGIPLSRCFHQFISTDNFLNLTSTISSTFWEHTIILRARPDKVRKHAFRQFTNIARLWA